jgi:two-component system, sensor histidine kinase LadS
MPDLLDRLDDPKKHISARLTRAKSELEEVLVLIDKLPGAEAGAVAFIGHALNNFLTVTGATAELLQLHLDKADTEADTLLAGLLPTTDLMSYLVARLMNSAARSDVHLTMREVDLAAIVRTARKYYQRSADRKQIEIVAENADRAAPAWTDMAAIGAVLDNLVTNAIKYSPAGKTIWIRLTPEPNAVVCSIQDEGPGLSREDQAQLFRRGVRLAPVPTAGESSTGYGLAIAKELLDRLGGSIWCKSVLGQGACFSFRLPATSPSQGGEASGTS